MLYVPSKNGPRDRILSEYVRFRIRQWEEGGGQLKDLARAAGIAKSGPSTVKLGTGVGPSTTPKYAKAFGYKSQEELEHAAFSWWSDKGAAVETKLEEPAIQAAINYLVDLKQGTEAEMRTILAAYTHPRFLGRDVPWWINTLNIELRLDHEKMAAQGRADGALSAARKKAPESTRMLPDAASEPKLPAAAPAAARRKTRAG